MMLVFVRDDRVRFFMRLIVRFLQEKENAYPDSPIGKTESPEETQNENG